MWVWNRRGAYCVPCLVNNVDVEEVDLIFEDGLQGCVNTGQHCEVQYTIGWVISVANSRVLPEGIWINSFYSECCFVGFRLTNQSLYTTRFRRRFPPSLLRESLTERRTRMPWLNLLSKDNLNYHNIISLASFIYLFILEYHIIIVLYKYALT